MKKLCTALLLALTLGVTSPALAGGGKVIITGVANINQANEETLELLPGIGPTKAKAIVDRRKKGQFKKVDDLTRVKGIGRKTMARLRQYLTITGPSTIAEDRTEEPERK